MKELELSITIRETENNECEIVAVPLNHPELKSWIKGKNIEETFNKFIKIISNTNIRYWMLLEEKK